MATVKLSDILSLPVLRAADGAACGIAGNAVFTDNLTALGGFVLFDHAEDEMFVSADQIERYDGDAVMLKADAAILPWDKFAARINNPVNASLYDTDGKLIGKIRDVELDGDGSVKLLVGATFRIGTDALVSRGDSFVIARPDSFELLREVDKLLDEAIRSVKPPVKKRKPRAKKPPAQATPREETAPTDKAVAVNMDGANTAQTATDSSTNISKTAATESTTKTEPTAADASTSTTQTIMVNPTSVDTSTATAAPTVDKRPPRRRSSVISRALQADRPTATAPREVTTQETQLRAQAASAASDRETITPEESASVNTAIAKAYPTPSAPRPMQKEMPPVLTEKARQNHGISVDAHMPTRIIADYSFLLGRLVTADIELSDGGIIKKGAVILAETVNRARNCNKLLDLTVKSIS